MKVDECCNREWIFISRIVLGKSFAFFNDCSIVLSVTRISRYWWHNCWNTGMKLACIRSITSTVSLLIDNCCVFSSKCATAVHSCSEMQMYKAFETYSFKKCNSTLKRTTCDQSVTLEKKFNKGCLKNLYSLRMREKHWRLVRVIGVVWIRMVINLNMVLQFYMFSVFEAIPFHSLFSMLRNNVVVIIKNQCIFETPCISLEV